MLKGHYSEQFFPERMTMQNGKQEERLLFVQSLVTDSGVKGCLVFPIRSEGVKNLMRDAYISQDGWAYLLDKKEDETILRLSLIHIFLGKEDDTIYPSNKQVNTGLIKYNGFGYDSLNCL